MRPPGTAAAARRRHLRAAGVNALIGALAIAGSGIWAMLSGRAHPGAIDVALGAIAYAMLGLTLLRLIAAALAWPR